MAKRSKAFYLWIIFLLILTAMYIYSALELLAISNTFPKITLFGKTIDLNTVIKNYLFIPSPHATVYAPWDLLVAVYVFLVTSGLSIIASWGSLFKIEKYEIVDRRAVWLSLITLFIGLTAIAIEVGRTERAPYFYLGYANLRSNMLWMIVFYTGYALFLPFEFWVLIRRDVAHLAKTATGWKRILYKVLTLGITDDSEESRERDLKIARVLSGIVLAISIGAYTNMASIFSTARTFPFHGNPLLQLFYMPVFFVVLGTLAGLSVLSFAIIVTYWAKGQKIEGKLLELLHDIGRLQIVFVIAYAILLLVWNNIEVYTKILDSVIIAVEWIAGVVIPLALLLPSTHKGRFTLRLIVSSVSILAASFAVRYDMVIGRPLVLTELVPYMPSPLEVMFGVGAIGLCMLVYTIGELLLPIREEHVHV